MAVLAALWRAMAGDLSGAAFGVASSVYMGLHPLVLLVGAALVAACSFGSCCGGCFGDCLLEGAGAAFVVASSVYMGLHPLAPLVGELCLSLRLCVVLYP